MHPYVYKKHHKPHPSIALVVLCIMILSQPVYSCNAAARRIQIYSEFAKGYVHINGSRVVANKCDGECGFLFKVTIDHHYMLLYDIRSAKFICWNKNFKKLIAKKNPANLTFCKFEDKVSLMRNGSHVRYTTRDRKNREVEMRFHKFGAFARDKIIDKCLRKHYPKLGSKAIREMLHLNTLMVEESSHAMSRYKQLSTNCASPDFVVAKREKDEECSSSMKDFCKRMKMLRDRGHSIRPEIMDLCKNVNSKN